MFANNSNDAALPRNRVIKDKLEGHPDSLTLPSLSLYYGFIRTSILLQSLPLVSPSQGHFAPAGIKEVKDSLLLLKVLQLCWCICTCVESLTAVIMFFFFPRFNVTVYVILRPGLP